MAAKVNCKEQTKVELAKTKNAPVHSPMNRGVPNTASPAAPSAAGAGGFPENVRSPTLRAQFLNPSVELEIPAQLQPWLVPQLWHK